MMVEPLSLIIAQARAPLIYRSLITLCLIRDCDAVVSVESIDYLGGGPDPTGKSPNQLDAAHGLPAHSPAHGVMPGSFATA